MIQRLPVVILLGDFHHNGASLSDLVRFIYRLSKSCSHIFIASSCQPWLSTLLGLLFQCSTYKYLELSEDLVKISSGEGINDLNCNYQLGVQVEACDSLSLFQPKRSIYTWNLWANRFKPASFHSRMAKRDWLELLLTRCSQYRVPSLSGQLSPQVTYAAMLGIPVITDINALCYTQSLPANSSDHPIFIPLTVSDSLCIKKDMPLSIENSLQRYCRIHEAISRSEFHWKPGMQLYRTNCQADNNDPYLPRWVWIFDIAQTLLERYYIEAFVTDKVPSVHPLIKMCLSSLCSNIDLDVRGVKRLTIVLGENLLYLDISANDKSNLCRVYREDSYDFKRSLDKSIRKWKHDIWRMTNQVYLA